MSIKPWKILESTYLRPRFRIDKCEVASGAVFEPIVFEFHPWANVLALTKNKEAVLVKQYRHGVQDVLLELPGGIVDNDENPLEGARRELLEETGYAASDIVAFPSTWEGFGNPPVEAAIFRRPVAVGHYPVAEELRALGFRWFDPDDIHGLQALFERKNEALLDHNQRLAREHFSFETMRNKLGSLLADAGWLP